MTIANRRVSRTMLVVAGVVLGLWWFWWAPAVADALWVEPLLVSGLGSLAILVLFTIGRTAGRALPILILVLGNPVLRWGIFLAGITIYLFLHFADLPFWLDDLGMGIEEWLWRLEDFAIAVWWGEVPSWALALILTGLGGVIFLVRLAGGLGGTWKLLKGILASLALASFGIWWKMWDRYKWLTAGLLIITLLLFPIEKFAATLLGLACMVLVFRGWPRDNPLSPPPIEPFRLPVLRLLGLPDYLALMIGSVAILTTAVITTLTAGQFWPVIVGVAAAQAFFAWYVDKRPLTSDAWTTVTLIPKGKVVTMDSSKGVVGQFHLIPMKFGPISLLDPKGITDNLCRALGYSYVRFEPIGEEPGDPRRFQCWIFTAHLGFEDTEGNWVTGFRALGSYLVTL